MELYYACPYCLTKITDAQTEPGSDLEKTIKEPTLRKERPSQNKQKLPICHYHMGYLSEREQKEQIPDECICCKDILECMLKKMRQ